MKRPRSSITVISLVAIIALSPHQLHSATSASLRATQGPAVDSESVGSGIDEPHTAAIAADRSSSPQHLPPPIAIQKHEPPLTVKLSNSSHPRAASSSDNNSNNNSSRRRTNAPEIPLIGIGVGNLPHNKIPYILGSALSAPTSAANNKKKKVPNEELDYRLVDTSHTDSALEVLVGRSLSRLSSSSLGGSSSAATTTTTATTTASNDSVYHVMIKIWHTHLGYERTNLSVQDSLSDILPGFSANNNNDAKTTAGHKKKPSAATVVGTPDVRIHAILQYPRCYDELFSSPSYLNSPNFPTKYNDCKEEEAALDATTKKSGGPSPLLDKDNAWKRSYRALEELYHHGTLESIGISNFGPSDLTQLFDLATVGPHVYQGSLHTLLTQEPMVETLVRHGVHYQCYDVASTVWNGREGAPRAYAKLERIGAKHGGMMEKDENGSDISRSSSGSSSDVYGYSPVQVVLGWLVHHRGVGVIPGTTNPSHLAENSPKSLGGMPRFSPREALDVETAVLALVYGEDAIIDGKKNSKMGDTVSGGAEIITANGSGSHNDGTADDRDNFVAATSEGEGGVVATFFNTLPQPRSVRIFHVHPDTGEQIQISHGIPPGRSGRMIVNPDDVLIAYDGHGVAVKKFLVEKLNGSSVDFSVEL
mmetsp:Transcript_31608/g.66461  ORF Transcript_31608/g.66461 Transcript_31608/m.66461 type:complete len:648 (+) Transcript_31608:95-2038(+)